MDLNFNSMQDMLRKSVAEFLSKECPYEMVKELEESEEGYSPKLWKKVVELGWPAPIDTLQRLRVGRFRRSSRRPA